jgi:mannose-6-phosphate isomerase-like protein (cupin superfamily)
MNIIPKGWGHEVVLHDADGYTMKLLCFKANSKSSLHYHVQKHETWYVAAGSFTLIDPNMESFPLEPGNCVHLPAGAPHQLLCSTTGIIVEASTPHSDNDVIRLAPGDSQSPSEPLPRPQPQPPACEPPPQVTSPSPSPDTDEPPAG